MTTRYPFATLLATCGHQDMVGHPPWLLGRAIVRLACHIVSGEEHPSEWDAQAAIEDTVEELEATLAADMGTPDALLL